MVKTLRSTLMRIARSQPSERAKTSVLSVPRQPSNVKYTDRVRLHPNLARSLPMPYRHRDSMSRKLRAMRNARERRRLEGVEPRYPRDLPALRRTLIIIDY